MKGTTVQIISVGYESRSLEELVQVLQRAGVELLLDVRELPLSRRKGFSKTPLSNRLTESGIEYRHVKVAGNPYRQQRGNTERCLALYSAHLTRNPTIVSEVVSHLEDASKVAVLCVEHEHSACHRSILIEKLRQRLRRLEIQRV
jgi:uncharacterized protein (DUF488 family)